MPTRLAAMTATLSALAAGSAFGVVGPADASGAVQVGYLPPPHAGVICGGILTTPIVADPANSFVVPAPGGVITSWQTTTLSSGQARLKLLRPTGVPNHYLVAAESTAQSVGPNQTPTPKFPTRIAAQTGDLIGLYSDADCLAYPLPGYSTQGYSGPDTAPGGSFDAGAPVAGESTLVAATVEPDGDGDGFGDESQDKCVGTAGAINGCPSALIGAASAAQVGKSAQITVTATVPGAGTLKAGDASDATVASASSVKLTPASQTLTSTSPQRVALTLGLTKAAKKKLKKKGKLGVQVKVLYTPPGGSAGPAQTLQVKLKGKKKKR